MSDTAATSESRADELALTLNAGDAHYRAFVGPPQVYDLISAMVFNLLTSIGLRQHHRLLDIGCGSLRCGRLLIPYLNPGSYFGIEPNRWLVEDGIANETGRDLITIKRPTFSFSDSAEEFREPLNADFAIAQSIFSHCGQGLIRHWLGQVAPHLKQSGALLATFLIDDKDFEGEGWIYPGCVYYRPETMAALAAEAGFAFRLLDWAHPYQAWALFYKPDFDRSLIEGGDISWNRCVSRTSGRPYKPTLIRRLNHRVCAAMSGGRGRPDLDDAASTYAGESLKDPDTNE